MEKPDVHIMVCNSFRVGGEPQGVCANKDVKDLLPILQEGLLDRGIDGVITATGCLKVCDRGPAMVVYPQNWWYGEVDEDKLEQILDALEAGEAVEDLLIA
jgi:(2Fe-2S) ferredoxin